MKPFGIEGEVRDPARGVPADQVYILSLARDVAARVEDGARTAQTVLHAIVHLAGDRRLALAVALDLPHPELFDGGAVRRALHGIYELEAALGAAYGRAHSGRR